jgi:hypothetical protein
MEGVTQTHLSISNYSIKKEWKMCETCVQHVCKEKMITSTGNAGGGGCDSHIPGFIVEW